LRRLPTLLLLVPLAAGCVTVAPRSRAPGDGARVLAEVPVRRFGFERCGAGSLAAALAALGDPVSVEELDAALPKAANGGVLSLDLVLEARRRGHEARLVAGGPELVRAELAAGRAPILLLRVLDAPGVSRDYWHYAVADGWDPGKGLVRVQFGDGKARWTTFAALDRAWEPGGRGTIVVSPGPPISPPAENGLRFAVALEEAGRPAEAARLYRRLLADDPASALLWTGLGNAEVAAGDTVAGEAAYREALARDPGAADALNNLAWLLYEEGSRLAEAEGLARRSVAAGGPDPWLALDTLGRILHARGRCAEAARTLRRASAAAPPGTAAPVDLALGRALAECGDRAGAEAALRRAASDATDDTTRRQAESSLAALAALAPTPPEP
jgi:tetratricopeptide (TPR) repeat protein